MPTMLYHHRRRFLRVNKSVNRLWDLFKLFCFRPATHHSIWYYNGSSGCFCCAGMHSGCFSRTKNDVLAWPQWPGACNPGWQIWHQHSASERCRDLILSIGFPALANCLFNYTCSSEHYSCPFQVCLEKHVDQYTCIEVSRRETDSMWLVIIQAEVDSEVMELL